MGSWCHSAEKCKSLCGRRPESLPSAENERVAAFSLQFGPIDRYIECNSRMLKYIALAPKKCAFVMCCKALALSSTKNVSSCVGRVAKVCSSAESGCLATFSLHLIPVEVLQFLSRNILRPLLEYSVCLKGTLGSWRHLYKKHVHKSS